MIKRTYFMSVRKAFNDGSGRVARSWSIRSFRSLTPDPCLAIILMFYEFNWPEDAQGDVDIIAFNRV